VSAPLKYFSILDASIADEDLSIEMYRRRKDGIGHNSGNEIGDGFKRRWSGEGRGNLINERDICYIRECNLSSNKQ